jgi:hypothetical protein
MKNLFTLAAVLLLATTTVAQNPVITFDKTTHDFGKINEADGRVTTTFSFKNEGMAPLVLSNVRASCGCTTPKWTREPIEPGQSGEITVTYNPSGRPGRFQKTVTVTSNATEPTTKLYIKGEVIPKPTQPTDQYPVKMGELALKKKSLNFGTITQGSNKMLEIEYANQSEQPVTVELLLRDEDSYMKPNVTLKTVEPKQTGKLQFALQSNECPLFGPVTVEAYVMVNGKREINDTYKISLSANIKEDFSKLTVEQRQQAPIVEVARELNLGTIAKGKKLIAKLTLTNAGVNPLLVRRVLMSNDNMQFVTPKAIKGGRKADIKMELDVTTYEPAQYTRILTLITNDPNTPVINIKLNWVVE